LPFSRELREGAAFPPPRRLEMDILDMLGGAPSARGRKAEPLSMAYLRDLNAGDVDQILNPPEQGVTTRPLVKLKSAHHTLAKLMAEGIKMVEASAITGYSLSRISILKNDPAFNELVHYYSQQKEQIYLDVHERLAKLGMSAAEELQERLEDDPDSFTVKELREVMSDALDRSSAPSKGMPKGSGQAFGQGQSSGPIVNIQFIGTQPEDLGGTGMGRVIDLNVLEGTTKP